MSDQLSLVKIYLYLTSVFVQYTDAEIAKRDDENDEIKQKLIRFIK